MHFIITVGLLVLFAWAISYAYDHWAAHGIARQERKEFFEKLAALPTINADFETPEGAILCFEDACRRRDIESAVACRDFETEAKLWLQERSHLSKHINGEHLPEIIKTTEKAFRDSLMKRWPVEWDQAKSYFIKREPYRGDIVVVGEVLRKIDDSLLNQRIMVVKTSRGWRVVSYLPNNQEEIN
jgi:hypothetical protein